MIFGSIPTPASTYPRQDQDGMVEESPFVGLAELCSRTCHVLEAMEDLGSIGETLEDLGRCVSPAQPIC